MVTSYKCDVLVKGEQAFAPCKNYRIRARQVGGSLFLFTWMNETRPGELGAGHQRNYPVPRYAVRVWGARGSDPTET